MVRQMSVRNALQVIVVRILRHAPVQEGPRQVIHCVLLVLNSFGDNLGVKMVVQAVIQMALDWQWLVKELKC
jgi:hypothetical protein